MTDSNHHGAVAGDKHSPGLELRSSRGDKVETKKTENPVDKEILKPPMLDMGPKKILDDEQSRKFLNSSSRLKRCTRRLEDLRGQDEERRLGEEEDEAATGKIGHNEVTEAIEDGERTDEIEPPPA